uniref:Persulfide dioxygenase ETHE1, mitochondrial n=1 Tax=Parastrongyloides trichosuri TaxID=131310 RepID=A0A0N4ZJV7_PARTI
MKAVKKPFIFRQLYEKMTSTYTYIIGCEKTRNAIIIDPVLETVDRDSKYIREMELNLIYGINTHVHADHVTGTGELRKLFPKMKSVLSPYAGGKADLFINYDKPLKAGELGFHFRSTPGHTNGCSTIISHDLEACFTGDTLLIRGCGRTDFQGGNAERLYKSIYEQIFTLPDHYKVYPGHDYNGVHNSTIREEKMFNPRLTRSLKQFVEIMDNLNLDHPKQIDRAVPANLNCGVFEMNDN